MNNERRRIQEELSFSTAAKRRIAMISSDELSSWFIQFLSVLYNQYLSLFILVVDLLVVDF